jgi:AbiV family abortive infection protein
MAERLLQHQAQGRGLAPAGSAEGDTMTEDAEDRWFALVENTVAAGARTIHNSLSFDRACDHIYGLLRDSALLLRSGSHPSSAFLSVTALEETAKVAVGMYRRSSQPTKRHADPLYRHRDKHHLAAAPTILIGTRLVAAIGEEEASQILELARTGGLVALRESSLYFDAVGEMVRVPADAITVRRARDLLLFALEAFDDSLVGYTSRSMQLGEAADALFVESLKVA